MTYSKVLSAILAGALAATVVGARADRKIEADDPVIVPESAVAVDHVQLIGNHKWTPLNRRMLLVEGGAQPFLFVLGDNCVRLMDRNVIIATRTPDITLYASDPIYVSKRTGGALNRSGTALDIRSDSLATLGDPCQIDRMYTILGEDVPVLREQLKPEDEKKTK